MQVYLYLYVLCFYYMQIRAFVDRLIEKHMAIKQGAKSWCSLLCKIYRGLLILVPGYQCKAPNDAKNEWMLLYNVILIGGSVIHFLPVFGGFAWTSVYCLGIIITIFHNGKMLLHIGSEEVCDVIWYLVLTMASIPVEDIDYFRMSHQFTRLY